MALDRDGTKLRTRTWLIASCVLVFITAAILRVGFVQELLSQHADLPASMQDSDNYGFLLPDSHEYLQLADNIAAGELDQAGSLARPPGYPLFLWMCGRSPFAILVVQALLGSLIPVCTFLLTYHLLRSLPISVAAGLVSASSPTGIGVTGLVLADLMLAVLFTAGLLVLLHGSVRQNIGWVLVPALLFGVGGMVKPVLLFWPVLSAMVWWLFRNGEGERTRLTQILVLVLVQGVFFAGWATCNYSRDKVFTVSEIGARTVREYWAVRVEEWDRAGSYPSVESHARNMDAVRLRLRDKLPGDRLRAYKEESLDILVSNPVLAFTAFLHNLNEPNTQGWNYFPIQVPLDLHLLSTLQKASKVESVVRRYSRWLVALGFLLMLIVSRVWRTAHNRRICLGICGVSVAYIYLTLCAGITFWAGTRIVYPIEAVTITILAAELDLLIRAVRSRASIRKHG